MQRAAAAQANGAFETEIVHVPVNDRKHGVINISADEAVDLSKISKLHRLKPVFSPTGTATPGNSSSIADGAASLIIMSGQGINERSSSLSPPLARIVGYVSHGQEPNIFTTAPVGAVKKLLARVHWNVDDVDLFEINEAFAVVTLASMKEIGVSSEKVNVNGGSCAIGHPIGASGSRILVTLIYALRARGLRKGIAVICIGGGESTAIAVETV